MPIGICKEASRDMPSWLCDESPLIKQTIMTMKESFYMQIHEYLFLFAFWLIFSTEKERRVSFQKFFEFLKPSLTRWLIVHLIVVVFTFLESTDRENICFMMRAIAHTLCEVNASIFRLDHSEWDCRDVGAEGRTAYTMLQINPFIRKWKLSKLLLNVNYFGT